MHTKLLFSFPLFANAVVIRGPQDGVPREALKIENIPPTSNIKGAKAMRIIYGPYVLSASNETTKLGTGASMDKGGTSYSDRLSSDFPKDVTVLKFNTEVQNSEFKRALLDEGIYNHHNVFIQINKVPPALFACASTKAKDAAQFSLLGGGATEMGGLDFSSSNEDKVKTGYYLAADREVLAQVDIVNYKTTRQTVYTSSVIEYIPGRPDGYIDSNQYIIEPSVCGGQNGLKIKPPVGVSKFSINTTDILVNRSGWFTLLRAHMHDGAVNMVLKINGKEVCNSVARYGGVGNMSKDPNGKIFETISSTDECLEPVKITKGDRLGTSAFYNLEVHPPRPMGGHHKRAMSTSLDDPESAFGEQMALMLSQFSATD